MNWIKANFFSVINLVILVYVIFELQTIRKIAEQTNEEAILNNVKLDFVESDINAEMINVDSLQRKIDAKKKEKSGK